MKLEIVEGPTRVARAEMLGAPSAVAVGDTICVFFQGRDRSIQYTTLSGGKWATPAPVAPPGSASSAPGAVLNTRIDKLQAYYQGPRGDGELRYQSGDGGGAKFGEATVPGSALSRSPAAVVHQRLAYVFYEGAREDGSLRFNSSVDGTWDVEKTVPNTGISGSPSATLFGTSDDLHLFYCGARGSKEVTMKVWNGSSWTNDATVPGVSARQGTVHAARLGARLYLFHCGTGFLDDALWYTGYSAGSWDANASSLGRILTREAVSAVAQGSDLNVFFNWWDEDRNDSLAWFRAREVG